MKNMECIRQALVLGLRDYANKSGFKQGLIGLSGGIDSAVTAALAVEALGKENIIGISLPSSFLVTTAGTTQGRSLKTLVLPTIPYPSRRSSTLQRTNLSPLFDRDGYRCDGRKPPGPQSGSFTDGGVQQAGCPPPDHRQQKRASGGILHPLRGYVRWTGSYFRPSQNQGICSGPALKQRWRNHSQKYH